MHKILKAEDGTGKIRHQLNITNSNNKYLWSPYKLDLKFKQLTTLTPPSADLNKNIAAMQEKGPKPKKTGSGLKNMSPGWQSGLNFLGSTLGGLSSGKLDEDQITTRESIRSGIGSLGPIGGIISAGTGLVDAIGAITGLNLDNLDQSAANRAGIGGKAKLQQTINSIPGVSMLAGMFSGKTIKSNKSAEIDQLASAYGGSVNDINAAQELGGKRMMGTGKANRFIRGANTTNDILTDIGLNQKLAKSNTMAENYISQNLNRYAGATPQLLLSKKGMKFPDLDNARKLISSWSLTSAEKQELQKFQLGGKMNLIPEGALHARKHQLEDVNPDLKDQITSKGIPVITQSEGKIIQQAEIEKDEWTLRKEFTDELESLYKLYQKDQSDEIAIKAGKLICYELLKNTDDRSGLIKSVK